MALMMALVLSASILVMPAAAAEEPVAVSTTQPAEVSALEDILNPEPVEEVEREVPLVNIIEAAKTQVAEGETGDAQDDKASSGEESGMDEEAQPPVEDTADETASAEEDADSEAEEEPEGSRDAAGEVDWSASQEAAESEQTADSLLTPGGEAESYTVLYYNGSDLLAQETVAAGGVPAAVPTMNGKKEAISGWLSASGGFVSPGETVITENTAYYAWYAPLLETEAHNRYINGYGDAMFAPENLMTRAQAATILYNLLVSKERGAYDVSFTDVAEDAWYYEPIMTLASYRVLSGYGDGTFNPERSVTRAEFVTMLARIFGMEEGNISFSDVSKSGWEAPYVATAVAKGWVLGYEDGTFRPYNGITRAEAVVIVNRVLNRVCDRDTVTNGDGILRYMDVSSENWYYWDVMEASIAHTYTRTSTGEKWTNFTVESCGLEPGLQTVNGVMCYVSKDTLQLVPVKAGLNKIEGEFYYAAEDGLVIDVALDEDEIPTGFNVIAGYNALFYWDGANKGARYLKKGLNEIGDYTFYADDAGYIINNSFGAGVVELDGKLYISEGNCTIATSYYDYTDYENKGAVLRDLAETTYEFQGNMYYVSKDYSLARDEWIGYLYFDKTGKYTTGDATLDAYVYDIVDDIIANNSLTQEEKLLKVYYHFRGGVTNTPGSNGYGYLNRGDGYVRRRYNEQEHIDWLQYCAKLFLRTKKGSCYYWAGAYLYCARRLGFQSYAVVGNLEFDREEWENARHCWCMIYWDGKWHISDVQTEWGYINRYYASTSMYYNLFAQELPRENVTYYANPQRPAICYFFKDEG